MKIVQKEKKDVRRVTFQIPDDLYEDIVRVSESQERTVSWLIRKSLKDIVAAHGN